MDIKKIILLPVSIVYGLITFIRNILFDMGIFREKKHPIPVISVGNLSMGGTGKTPHVEGLIWILKTRFKIATLSRGYGRKTKGFIVANGNADANSIGDEPMQYYSKFDDIVVAVDENRNRGVKKLMDLYDDLDTVILDDAFQHRWIKPDLSILLTDYHKMFHQDFVAPSGSLREFRRGSKRADIVIVTKTPVVLSPITRRRFIDELHLEPYQKLLFSKIKYEGFVCWQSGQVLDHTPNVSTIVLFAGIANSYPLQEYLQRLCTDLVVLSFPDHHEYKESDCQLIKKTYEEQFTSNKMIVTTEKDAQRLLVCDAKNLLEDLPVYYVPIQVVFHQNDEQELMDSLDNLFR